MVSEIDVLLSRYVEKHIVANLGTDMVTKIKKRLDEKGYSLTQAIRVFYPFEETLREFFGSGAYGMLQKIFRNIFEKKNGAKNTFVVKDKRFASLILETFGNEDKKSILQAVAESSMSVSEILDKADIPKSSGYKIINSLVDEGLLTVADQKTKNPDGNKVSAYKPTISSIDIRIQNASIGIEVRFSDDGVKKSHIVAAATRKKTTRS